MASGIRGIRSESSSPSLQLPLLYTSPDDECDGSVYSDELGPEKVDSSSSSLSKPSVRLSEEPVTDSFPAAGGVTHRRSRNIWRRLPALVPRIFRTRWSCSSNSGTRGSILGFESNFSQRPKPVRRVICVCLCILVMLFVIHPARTHHMLTRNQGPPAAHLSCLWTVFSLLPGPHTIGHPTLGSTWKRG
jgi:hypothetical protein